VVGATEKIASLRNRYRHTAESIAIYEEKVLKQQSKLERMNKSSDFGSQSQDEDGDCEEGMQQVFEPGMTEEDLRLEEQEIKELELKKRALEERVTGIEKDLGGLLR
jgi:type IV secretory pathway VirD2 relaxase